MAHFTINISTDGAAFDGQDLPFEIARILTDIALKVDNRGVDIGYFQTIRDINGNDVGRWALKEDDGSPGNA